MSRDDSVDTDRLLKLLDGVWDQLDFDSPWVADRERVEAEKMIERFVSWHEGRPGRTYVASEAPFSVEVSLGEGGTVKLNGTIDRVERDQRGDVVVVDLKTGKNAPSERSVADDPQLGLYQLVVESGGLDESCGQPATSGGAELVQLRLDVSGRPKVQVQGPQRRGPDGRRPVELQLASAARVLRDERFSATVNSHCQSCDFAAMCPARHRSTTVV